MGITCKNDHRAAHSMGNERWMNGCAQCEIERIDGVIKERLATCLIEAECVATQYDCDLPQPGDESFRRGAMAVVSVIRKFFNAQHDGPGAASSRTVPLDAVVVRQRTKGNDE